ncbi:MAG: CPBP family intramembrane metalloprotease [Chloroflexi bacterium]|nr:CPBP family intramembrane metalloprotease [Chloroflexota bacterium]
MNCNACGFVGKDGDAFCSSCGKPLAGPETDVVEQIETAPGTVTWRGREVALGILLILFCVIPVTGIAILLGRFAGRFEQAIGAWESSHLMGLAILIIVWRLGLRPRRLSISSLGLRPPTTSVRLSGLLAVAALGASLLATFLYATLVDYLGWQILAPPDIPDAIVFPGVASLATYEALALWTPITEEIFFRGFVFAGLAPRLGVPRAIVVSALVFSAFHLSLGVLAPIFITGVLLAWLYHRTGSLWPGIAAHAGQNALAVSAVIIGG